jgi:hypothetical protein
VLKIDNPEHIPKVAEMKLLFKPSSIKLRNICIIFAKDCNRELNSTVYICPYLVIYFYLLIHVRIALLWTKLVSFESKAKNTFPSFRTHRSIYLHKMYMFENEASSCSSKHCRRSWSILVRVLCHDDDDHTNV